MWGNIIKLGQTALVSLVLASSAQAQSVRFDIPGAPSAVVDRIKRVSLAQSLTTDPDARGSDFLAASQADYRRILRALYEEGYYAGEVSIRVDGREAAQIAPFDHSGPVQRVDIRVVPGRPFTFGTARAAPLPARTSLTPDFATGAPARADAIRDGARDAIAAWRAQGHAKARVTESDLRADHPRAQLDAHLRVDPGPRLRFGRLQVEGDSRVRAARVREIAGLPVGKPFDPAALDYAQRRLRQTGVFDIVRLDEAAQWSGDVLPITVHLSDRKPRRIGAGVEYASDDGLSLSGFWLHRNLRNGAERLRVSGKLSNILFDGTRPDIEARLAFSRPTTFGTDNTLKIDLAYQSVQRPAYRYEAVSGYVGIEREVNAHFNLNYGLGYLRAHGRDSNGIRTYRLITLPIEATQEKRDDPKDARRGYFLRAELTPFWGGRRVGRGYHIKADARGYRSFGDNDRVTLAGRVQFGSLSGIDARTAPVDYLFYSGGGGTVRGQAYQSLGIAGNNAQGGHSFFGVQAETRVRITPKWGAVGFVDAGNVGPSPQPLSGGQWHFGAGFGVRYDTALGPVRLDLAAPIGPNSSLRRGQVYLGIGQAF